MSRDVKAQNSRKKGRNQRNTNSKYRGRKDNDREKFEEKEVESPSNDPAWYGYTPELLRDAASIPFSNAAGVPFNMVSTKNGIVGKSLTVPGLMSFDIIPCPWVDVGPSDPVNLAANSMLAYVVHANSRNLTYGASDLMIYNIAMGNVYAYINFLMRVYGTSQLFSTFNRNIPALLARAQKVDYSDLINHLADFRYGINVLINKAASFAAPADMPYFRRLAFLFSGIYSEGESIKDQLYLYTPAGFMIYDETSSTTGGMLKMKAFDSVGYTVDQLIKYGDDMLNAIIGSEDMNVISGDILKAYGQEGLLKLATMPEVYTVLPVTDLAVLEQMQNATFLDVSYSNINSVQLEQSSSHKNTFSLVGGVKIKAYSSSIALDSATDNFMCNTILTDPQAPDIMERTRLQCSLQFIDETEGVYVYNATEVVRKVQIFTNNGNNPVIDDLPAAVMIPTAPTLQQVQSYLDVHCKAETFKFHPKMWYFVNNGLLNFAMDTDNYAVYDEAVLSRMNEAAVLSLFHTHTINIVR